MLPYIQKDKPSFINWLQTIMVMLFLIIAPFYFALFNGYDIYYEHSIYFSVLWASIILLIVSVRLFKGWQLSNSRDWLSIIIWLIPLTYAVSMSNAASPHLSLNMLYLNVMCAAFFVFGAYYAVNRFASAVLQNGITIIGYIVVLFGLANFFGNVYYQDAVMLDQGIRLTSVFQYANSYAAFVIAILFVCIYYLVTLQKRSYILIHGFMLVPLILSLLLTLSRGGIVVLPVIFLLVLPFIPMVRQLLAVIYIGIAGLVTLTISGKITEWGMQIANKVLPTATPDWKADTFSPFESPSLSCWGLLLGASIVTALIVFAIHTWGAPWLEKKLERLSNVKLSSIALPAFFIVLGGISVFLLFGNTGFTKILPDTIKSRIEGINFNENSVLERFTFYKDSIKLVKDYPAFGAGGGGWAVLYEKYQNNPYTSRQAHSFFMQSLVETGIVGFAVLLLFLAWVFYSYIRNYIKSSTEERERQFVFYIVAISLLIHSAIDFDISYAYLAVLIFLCMGGMISGFKTKVVNGDSEKKRSSLRLLYPIATGVIAIIVVYMMLVNLKANSRYTDAVERIEAGEVFENVISPLNKALEIQPYHPDINLKKIDLFISAYDQTKNNIFSDEAIRLIELIKQHEPNNRFSIDREFLLFTKMDDKTRALHASLEGVVKLPWDIDMYDRSILLLFELGDKARLDKKTELQNQQWDKLLELFSTVTRKTEELKLLPKGQLQGRPFGITPNMSLVAGQVYFIRGDYSNAVITLKQSLPEVLDNKTNVSLARWYLAALTKMNQSDDAVYDRLIKADPREKEYLEGIVNYNF